MRRVLPIAAVVALVLPGVAAAAAPCEPVVATVVAAQGRVEVRRPPSATWEAVSAGEALCPEDALRVRERSRAAVALSDGSLLRLDQETTITLIATAEPRASLIDLVRGAAHFLSRVTRGLRIRTPFVNGTVEGTEFWVEVTGDRTLLTVLEGRVTVENVAGRLTLGSGEAALARAGAPPVPYLVVRPRDAVQWALHFPTVVDYRPEDFTEPAVRRSVAARRAGDLAEAFAQLGPVPAEPRALAYEASLLLSVGRVAEARASLDRALTLDPRHGEALALRSVMAVALNDPDEALRLAREAVTADPRSAAAHAARSYALQARFDLRGARSSVEEALRLRPEDALVSARLAELRLAEGDVRGARRAAERAASLAPELARTQVVLGFARLADLDPRRASEAFERAIALDPADPLARLGLGLARIRRSDLEGGRREMEIAASLDPNNAVVRSYLGKAYYEERRSGPAAAELAAARALDPRDPTPWFYGAILAQSLNRPVEALRDLERAIELNDNRAVYRSRLLLDEDLAARSASLGRIYGDLGFDQLALVEGTKAVAAEPASSAGHRFLADAYAALPRHQMARASEVLQAQLFQPLNVNPVPPRLSAADLFIPEGAGPAVPAFNEFDALFSRDRARIEVSGVAGSNSTAGDEATLSGVWSRFAYSLGQFHYESDGFRLNNDQNQDIYNAFGQARLTSSTSVQAEVRYRDFDAGDLALRFDPENFLRDLRQVDDVRSARVGGRQALGPSSDLLVSVIAASADTSRRVADLIRLEDDEEGVAVEGQLLWRARRLDIVAGGGYFESDLVSRTEAPLFGISDRAESSPRHANGYVHSHLSPIRSLTATLGASVESYEDRTVDLTRVNPKVGAVWTPLPGTALRAAYIRTLKRRLITKETIEPTHVAGFNQFFDDVNGTDAKRFGVGLEQKLPMGLFLGGELVRRTLEIPFTIGVSTTARAHWDEDLARAYVYWTPASWLALRGEYRYERLDRDRVLDEGILRAETHRVPLTASVFHRSGLRGRLTATRVLQRGAFEDATFAIQPGEDRFWVVDASIGYRLPRRWGLVSLEARNLFDERVRFQDTDPANPEISPERLIVARFTVAF